MHIKVVFAQFICSVIITSVLENVYSGGTEVTTMPRCATAREFKKSSAENSLCVFNCTKTNLKELKQNEGIQISFNEQV